VPEQRHNRDSDTAQAAMNDFSLRPAREADFESIRRLIRQEQLNPFGLDWRRFLLAIDAREKMIGCGQIKQHRDGSYELASIATRPDWRKRGVASSVIEHLVASHPGALYLTCRAPLEMFYNRFGFRVLAPAEMPPYFRRLKRIAMTIRRLHLVDEEMLVMQRHPHQA
jgi:N-acetylglutamate synthase-like GNAT family acetyltransferase